MPGIFEILKDSYHMTPMGKIFFSSLAAQAIHNTLEIDNKKIIPQEKITPEEEAWQHYQKVLKMIDSCNGESMKNFINCKKEVKKSILLTLFNQTNRVDLIPPLQRYIFPTL